MKYSAFMGRVPNIFAVAVLSLCAVACQDRHLSSDPSASTFASAQEGGVDGSGGNANASTPALVQAVAERMPEFIGILSQRMEMHHLHYQRIKEEPSSPEDRHEEESERAFSTVLEALFTERNIHGTSLRDFLEQGRLSTVFKSPCRHAGGTSDATGSTEGVVCVDIQRLSRVPQKALVQEMLALYFHEIAHVYGFDESHAQHTQDLLTTFIPSGLMLPMDVLGDIFFAYEAFEKSLSELSSTTLGRVLDKPRACHLIGRLEAQAQMLNDFNKSYVATPHSAELGLEKILKLSTELTQFCQTPSSAPIESTLADLKSVFASEDQYMKTFLASRPASSMSNEKFETIFHWKNFFSNYGIEIQH